MSPLLLYSTFYEPHKTRTGKEADRAPPMSRQQSLWSSNEQNAGSTRSHQWLLAGLQQHVLSVSHDCGWLKCCGPQEACHILSSPSLHLYQSLSISPAFPPWSPVLPPSFHVAFQSFLFFSLSTPCVSPLYATFIYRSQLSAHSIHPPPTHTKNISLHTHTRSHRQKYTWGWCRSLQTPTTALQHISYLIANMVTHDMLWLQLNLTTMQ